jgi:uncharacterized protein (DUF2147 family)
MSAKGKSGQAGGNQRSDPAPPEPDSLGEIPSATDKRSCSRLTKFDSPGRQSSLALHSNFAFIDLMRNARLLLLLLLGLFPSLPATAAPDQLCGLWLNQEQDARLQIYQKHETFEAKIVWLKEPNADGKPKVDRNNPDPALRSRPTLGLVILHDLRKSDDPNLYKGGRIYDPKNGKTYDCRVTYEDDKLALRGFVLGMPFLGRTATWTKASGAGYETSR